MLIILLKLPFVELTVPPEIIENVIPVAIKLLILLVPIYSVVPVKIFVFLR